eukprot:1955310-Pleurochrysis_carterae.AAC.1
MSSFEGAKRPKQIRRKPRDDDDEEMETTSAHLSSSGPNAVAMKKDTAKAAAGSGVLSFNLEEEGEAIKLRKKKKRRPVAFVARDEKPDEELAETRSQENVSMGVGRSGAASATNGSSSQTGHFCASSVEASGACTSSNEVGTNASCVPTAEAIRAARAARERARREMDDGVDGMLATGANGDEFIPLPGRKRAGKSAGRRSGGFVGNGIADTGLADRIGMRYADGDGDEEDDSDNEVDWGQDWEQEQQESERA